MVDRELLATVLEASLFRQSESAVAAINAGGELSYEGALKCSVEFVDFMYGRRAANLAKLGCHRDAAELSTSLSELKRCLSDSSNREADFYGVKHREENYHIWIGSSGCSLLGCIKVEATEDPAFASIRLRCLCGFRTDSATVGFVGCCQSGTGHDAWRVARFVAKHERLETDDHTIPLDATLNRVSMEWRDTITVPHYRQIYGDCFASAPQFLTGTRTWCPGCRHRLLLLEQVRDV